MTKISLIAAMANNRVIGKSNKLPWNIPEDMKWFRNNTKEKPVIMGRKTFESIGRLLPKRDNIIITRKLDYSVKGAIVVNSIEDAFVAYKNKSEIMVIGGEEIYKLALPHAGRIYLTYINKDFEGDAYFPELDVSWFVNANNMWEGTNSTLDLPYYFSILERNNGFVRSMGPKTNKEKA